MKTVEDQMKQYSSCLFVGLKDVKGKLEAEMLSKGNSDDIIRSLCSLVRNPENQIGGRVLRNILYSTVITIMAQDKNDMHDFFDAIYQVSNNEEDGQQ